ncbi:MAG: iron-sulfur cluster assembly accessory protein, partial [Dehalococcoidia bacterium]
MSAAPLPGMGATISSQPQTSEAAPAIYDGPLVTITDRAAVKARGILTTKGHEDGMLRVFVVGGGCSGYQYGMSIAPNAEAEDEVIVTDDGVRIVIDRESKPMIAGAEIDYVEDLMKSGFTIYNPNAVSSCACGSSFQAAG